MALLSDVADAATGTAALLTRCVSVALTGFGFMLSYSISVA